MLDEIAITLMVLSVLLLAGSLIFVLYLVYIASLYFESGCTLRESAKLAWWDVKR